MTADSRALPSVQTLLCEAARAHEQRNFTQAGELALQALRLEPDNAEAHYLTGLTCLDTHQVNRALKHLNRAVVLNARSAEYTTHFARALARSQRYSEALLVANIAYALPPASALTLDVLGSIYMQCNAHERANVLFQRAVTMAPENANFRFNAAVTDTFTGHPAAAEEQFDACLERQPKFWRAYGLRSRLRRQTATSNHIDVLEELLVANVDNVDARVHLHGALGKEYEDLGDYAKAFEQLGLGKATARTRVTYQPTQDSAMVDALIEAFPAELSADTGYGSDEPIFIVGMPRSGTTLVDRILSSHPEVYSAGELMNFRAQWLRTAPPGVPARVEPALVAQSDRLDWELLGLRYVDSTRPQTAVKPRFIDKLPHNFMYLGLIAKALPKAKIICLQRHPLDTCLSIFREVFMENSAFHGYSFDLLDIGRFYIQFDRMMAHWNRIMPGRVLRVDYETMISEQESTTRRLLAHCELGWNDACLHFERNTSAVATASTVQVRQPMHRQSIGRWENYRPWLGPLEQLLKQARIDMRAVPATGSE